MFMRTVVLDLYIYRQMRLWCEVAVAAAQGGDLPFENF